MASADQPRRYYITTSVWQLLLAGDHPEERALTERFLAELAVAGTLAVSDVVLQEIDRLVQPEALFALITRHRPELLALTREAKELADRYLLIGLFPARCVALHPAIGVVRHCDMMVSWDCEHIVKLKTRLRINGMNRLLGYRDLAIVSPRETSEAPLTSQNCRTLAELQRVRQRLTRDYEGLSALDCVARTRDEVEALIARRRLPLTRSTSGSGASGESPSRH